jgi:hypothetical protein
VTADAPPSARDAATVADLLARERRHPAPALRTTGDGRDRTRSYRDCLTTAYKAGNFLRFLGVRGPGEGAAPVGVEIAPEPRPEPVLTFLGATLLGAVGRFEVRADGDARATVVPVADESRHEPPPGSRLAVYGGAPARSATDHWEEQVWSENPVVHPAAVGPETPALATGAGDRYDHGTLVGAARSVAADAGVGPGDGVVLRASLADPRAVVAGVLAPLLAGATVVLSDGDGPAGRVGVGGGPEPERLPLGAVPL